MMSKTRFAIGALALSASGLIGILGYEGYSETACIPVPGDVPTIGFGSTEGVKLGDTITPEKAIERAYRDIQKTESAIHKCVHVPLSDNEYSSFVSLAYNIGTSAFCSSTLVKKLNARDYEGACKEILRWNKQKKIVNGKSQYVEVKGLTIRREKEYQTCISR